MALVRELAFPRPCSQRADHARAAAIVRGHFAALGLRVESQGIHGNLLALPPAAPASRPLTVVSAHFDSVAGTPGADDNASAVAVMIGVARALVRVGRTDVGFIAWNAEEDGILGSADFAAAWLQTKQPPIAGVHVLEMLGFASHAPGSQRFPPGLLSRLKLPTTADFIGVLGNHGARSLVKRIVAAADDASEIPLVALQTYFGVEKLLPSLDLSDHVRLWAAGIPAVLWTDTAFYRNPHYHLDSDTPETLDPDFLSAVAHLLFRALAI